MKKIPLGGKHAGGRIALVDDEDYPLLSRLNWFVTDTGYAACSLNSGSNVKMHRLILGPSSNFVPDHINTDRLDNRKSNLRFCTPQQNNTNSSLRSSNTSGFKGVRFREGCPYRPWRALIMVNRKNKHLGAFSTPEKAAEAYDKAALELHGKFARTNKMMGLLK